MTDIYDTVRIAAKKSATFGATKYAHASLIISKKNKILAVGRNHFRGEIVAAEDGRPIKRTVHSEIHALMQVNVRRLDGAILVNYACSKGLQGNAVVSRPCDICFAVCKKLGFAKVIYSSHPDHNGNAVWKEEKF